MEKKLSRRQGFQKLENYCYSETDRRTYTQTDATVYTHYHAAFASVKIRHV